MFDNGKITHDKQGSTAVDAIDLDAEYSENAAAAFGYAAEVFSHAALMADCTVNFIWEDTLTVDGYSELKREMERLYTKLSLLRSRCEQAG